MEPGGNYDEMKPNFSTELAHKRVSELRPGNSATTTTTLDEFEIIVPLLNAPVTIEETTGAYIDVEDRNNDVIYDPSFHSTKKKTDMDEISSDGCTSKIPLIPTVSVYILIVIIIGITLAFNKKRTADIPNIGERLKNIYMD
jgi:hypothetical protein